MFTRVYLILLTDTIRNSVSNKLGSLYLHAIFQKRYLHNIINT